MVFETVRLPVTTVPGAAFGVNVNDTSRVTPAAMKVLDGAMSADAVGWLEQNVNVRPMPVVFVICNWIVFVEP